MFKLEDLISILDKGAGIETAVPKTLIDQLPSEIQSDLRGETGHNVYSATKFVEFASGDTTSPIFEEVVVFNQKDETGESDEFGNYPDIRTELP